MYSLYTTQSFKLQWHLFLPNTHASSLIVADLIILAFSSPHLVNTHTHCHHNPCHSAFVTSTSSLPKVGHLAMAIINHSWHCCCHNASSTAPLYSYFDTNTMTPLSCSLPPLGTNLVVSYWHFKPLAMLYWCHGPPLFRSRHWWRPLVRALTFGWNALLPTHPSLSTHGHLHLPNSPKMAICFTTQQPSLEHPHQPGMLTILMALEQHSCFTATLVVGGGVKSNTYKSA